MENLQGFQGLTVLEEAAIHLNELYNALVSGGFNEDQALSIVAKMIKNDKTSEAT